MSAAVSVSLDGKVVLVQGPRLDVVIGRMAARRGVPAEVVQAEMTQLSAGAVMY